jgi:hypothetical protein
MRARRYCEDCRFCQVPAGGLAYARCGHDKAPPVSLGDRFVARQFDKPAFAATARNSRQLCGPDAAWFEQKSQTQSQAGPSPESQSAFTSEPQAA